MRREAGIFSIAENFSEMQKMLTIPIKKAIDSLKMREKKLNGMNTNILVVRIKSSVSIV